MPRCRITVFPGPWDSTVSEASGQSRAYRTASSFSPFWCSPGGPHRLRGSSLGLQLLDCRKEQISQAMYIARGRETHHWTAISCNSISAMTDLGIVHRENGRGTKGGGQLSCREANTFPDTAVSVLVLVPGAGRVGAVFHTKRDANLTCDRDSRQGEVV